jgi:hypothetical protein
VVLNKQELIEAPIVQTQSFHVNGQLKQNVEDMMSILQQQLKQFPDEGSFSKCNSSQLVEGVSSLMEPPQPESRKRQHTSINYELKFFETELGKPHSAGSSVLAAPELGPEERCSPMRNSRISQKDTRPRPEIAEKVRNQLIFIRNKASMAYTY